MSWILTCLGVALAADSDTWLERARADAARARQESPALATEIAAVAPITTRSGAVRFTDARLRTPAAAPLLVERLMDGGESAEVRAALAAALPHTAGDWSEAAAGLLATEADAGVRVQLAEALREATADAAWRGLASARADADAAVRAAAQRAMSGRSDGAEHASMVTGALSDPDADVRACAARAVGWLALGEAWTPVVALLADPDADVRLQALHALSRLDAARAGGLPAVARLRSDTDGRVARAAARM